MAKQSFEKVLDRILNYPQEKGCAYICGPHLEPCVMIRAHDGDCECRECNANSPFRIAAQKWREKQGMSKPTQQGQNVSHLDCEMSHQDANGGLQHLMSVMLKLTGPVDDPVVIQDDGSGNQITASGRVLR